MALSTAKSYNIAVHSSCITLYIDYDICDTHSYEALLNIVVDKSPSEIF